MDVLEGRGWFKLAERCDWLGSPSVLRAEVAGLIPMARVTDNFAAPLEEAHARFRKLFIDRVEASSTAGL